MVACEYGDGDLSLVAYLVASPEPKLSELRSFLGLSLPEHMMPSRLVAIDALPLTSSGKVDRRALPDPGTIQSRSADCVAQFVTDFQNLFPGFTIGDVQGHLGLPIPGYLFPTGGQAHFLQPFGELLKGQAIAAHNACPFDLTP